MTTFSRGDLAAFAVRFNPKRYESSFLPEGEGPQDFYKYFNTTVGPFLRKNGIKGVQFAQIWRMILGHAYQYAEQINHISAHDGAHGHNVGKPFAVAFGGIGKLVEAVQNRELNVNDIPETYKRTTNGLERSIRIQVKNSLIKKLRRTRSFLKDWEEARNPDYLNSDYEIDSILERIIKDDLTTIGYIDFLNEDDINLFVDESETQSRIMFLEDRILEVEDDLSEIKFMLGVENE